MQAVEYLYLSSERFFLIVYFLQSKNCLICLLEKSKN